MEKNNLDNSFDFMKKIQPDFYTQTKKLICDWTDKKNCLILYKLLKFYVRHGMIVDKVLSVISFKQEKWLEKFIDSKTQERNIAKIDFEKNFYKLLINPFNGNTIEKVRNRINVEFIKKLKKMILIK